MDQWGDFSVTKIATSVVLALLISFMFWKITYFPFPQKVLRRVPGISLLSSGQMIIPPFVIKPKRNMSPELIPNLPTELLELIFKQTTWDALKACSLVCRRWNDLTRSWPIFTDLTFVLDNRYQREKRDGSQIVLHHRSTLRPRRVTLVCNSLPYVTGIALMNGGWFQEVRFSSIYSLRLRGVLTEKMKWASASLVFYIIELDLGLQFFESVHSLFHLISSFEVLETLRIACRSPWPATSQFQAQHCVPQGRISPRLRSLYFGGNSAFLFPYFATWFSLVGGLHRPIKIFVPIGAVSTLHSFWMFLSAIPGSIQSIYIAFAFHLPLSFRHSDLTFLSYPISPQSSHFTRLQAITIKDLCSNEADHPSDRMTDVIESAFIPFLAALASPSVRVISLSTSRRCVDPSMRWRTLDGVLTSCYENLKSIRPSSRCPYSGKETVDADIWQGRLPLQAAGIKVG